MVPSQQDATIASSVDQNIVPDLSITISGVVPRYGDDLARAGLAADHASRGDAFAQYHAEQTENTRAAQLDALKCFSTYLAQAGIERAILDLYQDAEAWRGMSAGLLKGFRTWLLEEGYAIGTINHRLAIIRQYCRLAHEAGVLSDETLELVLAVKGHGGKTGRNLDNDRARRSVPTRKSTKKAAPTPVSKAQALRLKTETTRSERPRRRTHDLSLPARDALLMGLFIEHAFRVSEVAGLDVEDFDLEQGLVMVYREKTDETQTHQLKKHTLLAASRYLAETGATSGPLFLGYQGRRITRYGLYDRVRVLGQQVGLPTLSPHDLRHYWTYDALGNATPVDRMQSGGNWKSPMMVLKYARRTGVANDGVIITE
jgi:integrase